MIKNNLLILFLWCICCTQQAEAQRKKKDNQNGERSPKQELIYDNHIYLDEIKTVQLYPTGKESLFPVYTIGSTETINLSFDDLRADVRTYFYSIEHCNADWTASRVSPLDYAEGYNEDRIDDFQQSQGTFQAYTHYKLSFPNEYVRPKIAGNFLLKVYEDADKSRLILTRKFYVVRPLINTSIQIIPSPMTSNRLTHQKLNTVIKTGALTIANPYRDLHIQVLQNQRPDNMMLLNTPLFISEHEIKYNNNETLDFKGNNEFRFVDLRSFRGVSAQVKNISIDSITKIELFEDLDKSTLTYGSIFDENGRFYIRNLDYDNSDISADYADVLFSLKTDKAIKGTIYIVGGFNNYLKTEENKLIFNPTNGNWEVSLRLKQGLYDYEYILETADGKTITDYFSGSFYDTGNDYQVLVYHRRIGTYWDELLGIGEASINNRANTK